jgi:hypothetical protein
MGCGDCGHLCMPVSLPAALLAEVPAVHPGGPGVCAVLGVPGAVIQAAAVAGGYYVKYAILGGTQGACRCHPSRVDRKGAGLRKLMDRRAGSLPTACCSQIPHAAALKSAFWLAFT